MRSIELLAPAKNVECGMAAIDHGADAVYIGASHFGARVSAGNSVEDIERLCDYAHVFGAKVYVTVNTILYDNELDEARSLLARLDKIGVDAVLVQDMAVLKLLPPDCGMAMHASTQTDNRNADKVEWLRDRGFSRVVLARELTLDEIQSIHKSVPDVELEVFVHGALCVSYSGACYASEHCFKRSANRGACAQFCRLQFDLQDSEGRTVVKDKHLLSLKDMCRLDNLQELVDAGATSLKIEGRLKDAAYVKNVVAAYSRHLDKIVAAHPDKYRRASMGHVSYTFEPNLDKTFNRGFTSYFLHGRAANMASFLTPKAMGEYVGKVKEIRGGSFNVAGTASFSNGDGLCFVNKDNQLEGFRVNKVVNNRLYPTTLPRGLRPGIALYRNNDQEFERMMVKPTANRKMYVDMGLSYADGVLALTLADEGGATARSECRIDLQLAQKPQAENMNRQLGKLGNTPFEARHIELEGDVAERFVPSSTLAELRRQAVDVLLAGKRKRQTAATKPQLETKTCAKSCKALNIANVSNTLSRDYYNTLGMTDVPEAYELSHGRHGETPIMTCRYCLRHEMGYCVGKGGRRPSWREPLSLVLPDGRSFELKFDCKNCQMKVYAKD